MKNNNLFIQAEAEDDVYVFPASSAQQRFWFLDQLQPGNPAYNRCGAVRLQGSLDVGVLEKSLKQIVQRHEILRTTFANTEEQLVQVIAPKSELPFTLKDLRALPKAERMAEAQRLAGEEACQPFDLQRGPLFRTILFQLDVEDFLLVLNLHHIISDGWSNFVLFKEISTHYQAFTTGRPELVAELPLQYADYSTWQQEQLEGEVLKAQLAYWQNRLAGIAPLSLNLPTDYPRPAKPSFRGKRHFLNLNHELTASLKALSLKCDVTLNMTLAAAFQTLLFRYTGQTDIQIGIPIAGRNRFETNDLIGLFINTLVLRSDLTGEPTFRELLKQVREHTLEAYTNQDLPFEKLVEQLQPERDLGYNPLFQVNFVLQNTPPLSNELAGLDLEFIDIYNGTTMLDITLSLTEQNGELQGWLEYSVDLFEAATIAQLAEHFKCLLESVCLSPDLSISRLPLLSEAEQYRLLIDWNATQSSKINPAITIHELIELQAQATPERVAVIFEDEELTYRELSERTNKLAYHLQKLSVGPNILVGLYLERSLEMVIGLLGVLKAGGAYLPLDPSYPAERIDFMLKDAQVKVLLTQDWLMDDLPENEATIICLDSHWETIAEESCTPPASGSGPEQLAYVIYTSGSTGRPKGVMISHRAISNHMQWMQQTFPLTSQDKVLQKTPFSFDASVWEFYAPLMAGATLVLAAPGGHREPAYLIKVIREYQITVLQLVPSLLGVLIEEPDLEKCQSLKQLFCGGEALLPELQARVYQRLPAVLLCNLYGPTEATIDATYWICQPITTPNSQYKSVPIGRPIANTQTYVLDAHLQPVPVGVVGELYIGGAGLASGYLNQSDLTDKQFISNPFEGIGSGNKKLYRTGDLVCYRPDGVLVYIGRVDHQIKLRGFRVELAEIEAVIRQYPDIKEAVLVAHKTATGDTQLIAYLVSWAGKTVEPEIVQNYLKEILPDYMIPGSFLQLEELPLTPNGKIDRGALPAPEKVQATPLIDYVGPNTPVQEVLAGIWSQVLGLSKVGIYDNFFKLGGHSLLATQVISRTREAFDLELPLKSIFEHPTIAALATLIEEERNYKLKLIAPPGPVKQPREQPLSLSFAQQRLWFMSQLEADSTAYNISSVSRVHGFLNISALEYSFTQVVGRHEILRTNFGVVEGQPRQFIVPPQPLYLPLIDLSSLEPAEQKDELFSQVDEFVQQPFNLSQDPLIRVKLWKLTETEHILALSIHHIVMDGWSVNLLTQELSKFYRGWLTGQQVDVSELPIQYVDFAIWQREWLQGEVLEQQLSYWKGQLGPELPLTELVGDRLRPEVLSQQGNHYHFCFSSELTRQLKELSQQENVTLFMTLVAGFNVLLYHYTGQTDLVIGTDIAGRNRVEIEQLIGFFVNQLTLRTTFQANITFQELLKKVREITLDAYAHQDLPFEKLVKALKQERELNRAPLFQIKLSLQPTVTFDLKVTELSFESVKLRGTTTKLDISLLMAETAEGLNGLVEYSTDLFEQPTIELLVSRWKTLLEIFATHPAKRLNEVSFLTDAERQQLLVDWNQTEQFYPQSECFQHLFEKQVAHTPKAIALYFKQQSLTYSELNSKANRLAYYLQTLGVGPEVRVGLCIPRSPEMLIGLLAILKAGGAYVPIDPTYPKERLEYVLADSQVQLVLTAGGVDLQLAQIPEGTRVKIEDLRLTDSLLDNGDYPDTNPVNHSVDSTNLAYLLYTSGSTGRPKGTLIEHRALVNYLWWAVEYYQIREGKACPVHSPIGFDLTITSLLAPLVAGQGVWLQEEGPAIEELVERLSTDTPGDFSLVKLTPSHLQLLKLRLSSAKLAGQSRAMVIGGEALYWENLKFWREYAPQTRLINEYGPTETVVGCCIYEIEKTIPLEQIGTVPIGRPIANTQLYVLDKNLELVAIGVPGELYIGGAGVGRGYWNQPALTAERFIPNPFTIEPGTRLYKTGDMVMYLTNGQLVFLGRTDEQVKIRGYRVELGEIEAALEQHPAIETSAVKVWSEGSNKYLAAYLVASDKSEDKLPTSNELRIYLRDKLPEYMIPRFYVRLPELPLTVNGKLDRQHLPYPNDLVEQTELEARGEIPGVEPDWAETILLKIYSEVLGIAEIDIHDNFFTLGGDSIIAIEIIAKAVQAGLALRPKDLFQHQTIADLAAVAKAKTETNQRLPNNPDSTTGSLPLSPVQHWFFERNFTDMDHWNQAILLKTNQPLDFLNLEKTIQYLVTYHDGLRLRFVQQKEGWQQYYAPKEENQLVSQFDLSQSDKATQSSAIEEICTGLQTSLNLAAGPLLKVALFKCGPQEPDRVLVIVHHLVIDGISWRILLKDFEKVYWQVSNRAAIIQLPPKSSSYKSWAAQLVKYAQNADLEKEVPYWLGLLKASQSNSSDRLPVDYQIEPSSNLAQTSRVVSTMLTEGETRALLQELPAIYHTHINDLLLAALVHAFTPWTGSRSLLIEVDGHGRENIAQDLDISQTVGWFTSIFPVFLDLGKIQSLREELKLIKEQLRAVPRNGINYGVLRYLGEFKACEELRAAFPRPQVSFNYLGQFDHLLTSSNLFEIAPESAGSTVSPRSERTNLINVTSMIVNNRLKINFDYSKAIHTTSTIEALANQYVAALQGLISEAQAPIHTPSDFPLARFTQRQMDRLAGLQVEDIFPLSPLQKGILFYSFYPNSEGLYISQMACTLYGNLDVVAFEKACQKVVERHPSLRTSFMWEDLAEPVQLIYSHVNLELIKFDWRAINPGKQVTQFEEYLEADRQKGFNLTIPPLLRVTLIRISEIEYWFTWSHPHILLDGWSLQNIYREVFSFYEAFSQNQPDQINLSPVRPYREYISWIENQDKSRAETIWRQVLKDFSKPLNLVAHRPSGIAVQKEQLFELSDSGNKSLQQFARLHHLTINTLVQGAWALLLSFYSQEKDILFGTVVSGRPPTLPGVTYMVGLFINVIPVRAQLDPEATVLTYLSQLQAQQLELSQYDYLPLSTIQGWSEIPRDIPLFETLLTFENYPVEASLMDQAKPLQVRDPRWITRNNYLLNLLVTPGARLSFLLKYDSQVFEQARAAQMLELLENLLGQIVEGKDKKIADLMGWVNEFGREQQLKQEKLRQEARRQGLNKIKPKTITEPKERDS